ncbi:fosfomycin resistance glutathione transferase [Natronospirillum operosum]|uniref:Fosfomycin resistance glutathione transferase n=1 Tax=Natronospirillum operosum TaxID=2759953 RepID=A0A4Z0WC07_9GAMM|nr:fosfomycin resistance glutathione transferase [Natronospirillum operosum]TGG91745.1 fosfomycin resistance glutathione transferase [Natronospirillum operosum]
MITGINHLTFTVSNLNRSIGFYTDLLGLRLHVCWDSGAYLTAGDCWLCLSLGEPRPAGDYTHAAFSVSDDQLPILRERLGEAGVTEWKQNTSEGDSIYLLDPDGHQLELHSGSLASRLEALKEAPYKGLVWC